MKALAYKIFGLMLAVVLITGCKENDDLMMYENDPGVYFPLGISGVTIDSIGYNFILKPIDQTKDTIYIPVRIMGDVAEVDRLVELQVVDTSTAKEGTDFTFGPKIVRAGHFTDSIPLYVTRTAPLTSKILKLYLNIAPSKDFKVGYTGLTDFKISITDQLVPPVWSYTMNVTFGAFSTVKFRFMVSTLQRVSFSGIFPSELAAMGSKCKVALSQYEAANGPLLDESGLRVVFP